MVIRAVCPRCQSSTYETNGHIHSGTRNHHGHDWGRQLGPCSEPYLIWDDKRGLIERVLVERIPFRGIGRAVGGPQGVIGCSRPGRCGTAGASAGPAHPLSRQRHAAAP